MGENELLALAHRVEKLTELDREADVLIALAIDWRHNSAPCSLRHLHDALGVPLAEIVRDAESPQMITSQLPRYTASIDAAMTLVPEGFECNIFDARGGVQASLESQDVLIYSRAKTWPLALCAAALRARASLTPTTGE